MTSVIYLYRSINGITLITSQRFQKQSLTGSDDQFLRLPVIRQILSATLPDGVLSQIKNCEKLANGARRMANVIGILLGTDFALSIGSVKAFRRSKRSVDVWPHGSVSCHSAKIM